MLNKKRDANWKRYYPPLCSFFPAVSVNAEKHAKHTQAPRKIHVCCMRSTGGSRNPFVETINADTKKRKKKAQFSLINKDTFGAVY